MRLGVSEALHEAVADHHAGRKPKPSLFHFSLLHSSGCLSIAPANFDDLLGANFFDDFADQTPGDIVPHDDFSNPDRKHKS